jgi:hypothetical protein
MSKPISEWSEQYLHGDLSEEEMLTLAQLLDSDTQAREAFVEHITIDAAIGSAFSGRSWAVDAVAKKRRLHRRSWMRRGITAAMIAGFMLLGWLMAMNADRTKDLIHERAVATLNSTRNAVWNEWHASKEGWLYPGAYSLESGTVTFTFDSGAVVAVSGPAEFQLKSPFKMELSLGEACFFVDEPARGFVVDTPHATIEDMGTAFSVSVDDAADGGSDVNVVDGEVKVTSRVLETPVLYRAREAVRIDAAGNTKSIVYRGDKLRIPRPVTRGAVGAYIHLPLDQRWDGLFRSRQRGFKTGDQFLADTRAGFQSDVAPAYRAGKFGDALYFDGRGGAPIFDFAGGKSGRSHTLSLWVQVPADAAPAESTFLAFGNVHRQGDQLTLSWNHDTRAGAYGALRVDYGDGYVTGSMPVNDGDWHHIVLGFCGGKDARLATHVRLYVDSRLDEPSALRDEEILPDTRERMRPTFTGFRFAAEYPFRGALDELYITGGLLLPHEIQGLYRTNSLPSG